MKEQETKSTHGVFWPMLHTALQVHELHVANTHDEQGGIPEKEVDASFVVPITLG
ncbi:hypothetical protein [Pectobacterium polaris]|uniref:hypothetical protein n=1 Tax=Pectobacterium polaris TaxID=2042057 RepID=UPI001F15BE5D|nr:hypothetical protein [Pectobacterium polaris]